MIKTNRVKLNIHYDHIMQDYDIYKVGQDLNGMDKEQRKVVKNCVETLADSLSPALAVLYRYGGYLYAIFNKDSVSLQEMQSHIDVQGVFVEKIKDISSMYPNELCQLFLICSQIWNVLKNIIMCQEDYIILMVIHLLRIW